MIRAGSVLWFARHELRLAWREWVAMMTGGRRRRRLGFAAGLVAFAVFAHWVVWLIVGRDPPASDPRDTAMLVTLTGAGVMLLPVMVSQAMETVTRAFYSRADLDLILSSPVRAQRLFAVRIAAMAMSVTLTAMLVAAPVIDVMAFARGVHWLIAYAGIAVIGMMATAMAATVVSALFAAIGPRRTRLVAQVVAALIGAAFVIGIQVAAIMSYGSPSRGGFIRSELVMRHAPAPDSLFWWPARAILNGDVPSMAAFVALGAALLGVVILVLAPGFAARVTTASGEARSVSRRRRTAGFHIQSPARALRRKEWTLLLRDPWLVSQSLMQLLYLVVPAVLLWRSLGAGLDARALLVPVLIMTAGQLAGGLTWITVSGEDAPDLISSAPIRDAAVLRAKLEAVMGAVAIIFSPFLVVFALLSPFEAVVAAMGVAISAASATAVQLWFRAQARRSNFRRRQQSSRVATFAEAFSSISWAFAGVMAAGQAWLAALILSAMALAVLAGTWRISPAASRAS